MILIMKHKLPITIFVVAIAAAITGIISFQSGSFQAASVGELVRTIKPHQMSGVVIDFTPSDIAPDMPTSLPSAQCAGTTKPTLKILSPNGNETYTAGHKVTVKWISCNIPSTDKVHVALLWDSSREGVSGGVVQDASVNDNQAVVTLPTDVGNGGFYLKGKLYKVQVVQSNNGTPNYNGASDTSDASFTILNGTIVNPK